MAEAHIGSLPSGTKHCRVCAEPINKEALKCIHCQSDQSWFRQRLGFSTTMLSLLVALVSVLGTTLPVLIEAVTPKNSLIVISKPVITDFVAVLLTNRGIRPGYVSNPTVTFRNPQVGGNDVKLLGPDKSRGAITIEPGKSMVINFFNDRFQRSAGELLHHSGTWVCKFSIVVTDFLGQSKQEDFEVNCDLVRFLIGAPFPDTEAK